MCTNLPRSIHWRGGKKKNVMARARTNKVVDCNFMARARTNRVVDCPGPTNKKKALAAPGG